MFPKTTPCQNTFPNEYLSSLAPKKNNNAPKNKKIKAGYTTRHKSRRLGRGSIAIIPLSKKMGTDGPTDRPFYMRTLIFYHVMKVSKEISVDIN